MQGPSNSWIYILNKWIYLEFIANVIADVTGLVSYDIDLHPLLSFVVQLQHCSVYSQFTTQNSVRSELAVSPKARRTDNLWRG